jgi:6-phosphofructokinase 1
VIELMGRGAGWIAASTVLAKRQPDDAPHIILLPEIPFEEKAFLAKVKETVERLRYCIVVVGEGLKKADGTEFSADATRLDAFGHPVLAGAADRLVELVSGKLKIKARSVKLGYAQRCAEHYASDTDSREAYACGQSAVVAAVRGKTGCMVKLIRISSDPYKWTTGLQPLSDIANVENMIPRQWISADGFLPNKKLVDYARPLVEGTVRVPTQDGLPAFVVLKKKPVAKKLPPR